MSDRASSAAARRVTHLAGLAAARRVTHLAGFAAARGLAARGA